MAKAKRKDPHAEDRRRLEGLARQLSAGFDPHHHVAYMDRHARQVLECDDFPPAMQDEARALLARLDVLRELLAGGDAESAAGQAFAVALTYARMRTAQWDGAFDPDAVLWRGATVRVTATEKRLLQAADAGMTSAEVTAEGVCNNPRAIRTALSKLNAKLDKARSRYRIITREKRLAVEAAG